MKLSIGGKEFNIRECAIQRTSNAWNEHNGEECIVYVLHTRAHIWNVEMMLMGMRRKINLPIKSINKFFFLRSICIHSFSFVEMLSRRWWPRLFVFSIVTSAVTGEALIGKLANVWTRNTIPFGGLLFKSIIIIFECIFFPRKDVICVRVPIFYIVSKSPSTSLLPLTCWICIRLRCCLLVKMKLMMPLSLTARS